MCPAAPKRHCRKPGCGRLSEGPYCSEHAAKKKIEAKATAQRYDLERGSRHERGYDSKWVKYSKAYRELHPLCVKCEEKGKLTPVQCVDHIIPVDGPDDPLFWDKNNHQGL